MKKGIKGRVARKSAATGVSAEALKLLKHTLKRCHGSERQAAKVLRLANHAHLGRMLRGEMRETPAMKAAVIRARARAKRAFLMEPMGASTVDMEQLRQIVKEARWVIEVLDNFLR